VDFLDKLREVKKSQFFSTVYNHQLGSPLNKEFAISPKFLQQFSLAERRTQNFPNKTSA
jgi:hypothetical protein